MPVALKRKPIETGRTHAERRREAESRILQAAFEIVARRGVDQLTLAEAGEEAGYSRALAAHYFDGREELLAAVARHAVEKYRQRIVELKVPAPEGRESLLTRIAFYMDDSRGWPEQLKAFYEVMEAGLRWPSITKVVARINQEIVEQFSAQIRAAQARGEIRGDIDAVAEATAIWGTMRGVMTQWLIAPDGVDLDKVRDNYIAGLRRSWSR
jgi:TetR/AcrR family acrAB operon transcriptional repressor